MNQTDIDEPASQQIDAIIKNLNSWHSEKLSHLRALILQTDPMVIEQVKWKKPSRPLGVPVWFHNGNICIAEALKNAVRLTFPKGAQLADPKKLFNTRLDSKTIRAIDFYEHDELDTTALKTLIAQAVKLNQT